MTTIDIVAAAEPGFVGIRFAIILLGLAALPLCYSGRPAIDLAARLWRHGTALVIVATCFIYSPLAIAGVVAIVPEDLRMILRVAASLLLFTGLLFFVAAATIRSGGGEGAARRSIAMFVAMLILCIAGSYAAPWLTD